MVNLGPEIKPHEWKNRPMKDFSPLHRICSYLAMFPPNVASYFIDRFTQEGDTVLDPFCGRGTTPLEAVLQNRRAIGTDLNPLAIRLTKGKVHAPTDAKGMVRILRRVGELEKEYEETKDKYEADAQRIWRKGPTEPSVGVVFSKPTLQQLLFLREKLVTTVSDDEQLDGFLICIILGAMHGQTDSYFSVSMPNTFSMSPNYIQSYVKEKKLEYHNRNVFSIVRERAAAALYSVNEMNPNNPIIKKCDAKKIGDEISGEQVKMLFSSPPYLKVIKYGLFNWIRLWFLDISHKQVDESLSDNLALNAYIDFMRDVIDSSRKVIDSNGLACWVIGDVKHNGNTINLAREVWTRAVDHNKWELHITEGAELGFITDKISSSKKVTRIWNSGGHEIWHSSQDNEKDDCICHVDTQSQAESKLKELGSEYYSLPKGTSGQATPLDRILMIKPKGAHVYDRMLNDGEKTTHKGSQLLQLHVTRPYLEWVTGLDDINRKRYLRRLNKVEITRVILKKIGCELTEEERSNGSTVKKSVLLKIWYGTRKIIDIIDEGAPPKTKHALLADIYRMQDIEYNPKEDTSTSSTVTKIGMLKVLAGLQNITN